MRRHSPGQLYKRTGYGDWLAPVDSPKEPIAAAYYYHSTNLLARTAAVLGKKHDAETYAALAREIAEAFNDACFDPGTHQYPGGTQTANVLPLYFGIVPPAETAAVVDNVVYDIEARDNHTSTGFLGTSCLLPVLSDSGRHRTAFDLAAQTSCPSWGYMVEQGATTIWERWDADQQGPEMNSRNHAALGSAGRWFFETLAGINIDPAEPGFKHIVIRPIPVGGLTHAGAEYESVRGKITSKWRMADGRFFLNVTIPIGSRATVFVPVSDRRAVMEGNVQAGQAEGVRYLRDDRHAIVYEIGAGDYAFVADLR